LSQGRYEIADVIWSVIAPLPRTAARAPRVDDRKVLNAIFWRRRTGSP
jgi:transposase